MAHRYRKKTPSTRMYRHFAVVTVVSTGLLAIFADGAQTQAVEQQIEQQQVRTKEREKHAPVVTPPQQPGGVWGSSSAPDIASASLGSGIAGAASLAGSGNLAAAGYRPDYLSQFSAEQRSELSEAAAANIAGVEAGKSSLEAASRRRSGSLGRE